MKYVQVYWLPTESNNIFLIGSERGICSCSGMCECLNSPLGVPYEGTACECDADRCVNPDTRVSHMTIM